MQEHETTIFERAHRVGDWWDFFQALGRMLQGTVQVETINKEVTNEETGVSG